MKTTAVILAAGEGTRMKSNLPKVLHRALGKPLVQWVLDCVQAAGLDARVAVIGHGGAQVAEVVGTQAAVVKQERQLGTGHAVLQAAPSLPADGDCVLVLCGDTPLLRPETLQRLLAQHAAEQNAITVLTALAPDPTGYGRIVRDGARIVAIAEQKDADDAQKQIREINTGTYCFRQDFLLHYLQALDTDNAQGEYYLTDLVRIAVAHGLSVGGCLLEDFEESLGVNDRVQLSQAEAILRRRKCEEVMRSGVTLIDPAATYLGADVQIGRDTILYPNVVLEGHTVIGRDNLIGMNCRFVDSVIGDGNEIQSTVIVESTVGDHCKIGPMAYLRPGTALSDNVKIGDFVEVKKSQVGRGSKIPHLSYVGDALVGSSVNIGCGSITCNYDGVRKYQTVIGDGAFIGSNTNLVAPVTVEEDAFIGAGSTITRDVPADALALTRAELKVKRGWRSPKNGKRAEKDS